MITLASCYENNVIPIWKRYTTNIFLTLMENLYCEMTLIMIRITMEREKCTYYRAEREQIARGTDSGFEMVSKLWLIYGLAGYL